MLLIKQTILNSDQMQVIPVIEKQKSKPTNQPNTISTAL